MDKYALVTGGTKGIGKGIVQSLLDKDYIVIATYASDSNNAVLFQLSLTDTSDRLHIVQCDLSIVEEVYRLVAYVKDLTSHLDCLVCNAGATLRKKFQDITDKDWTDIMQVVVNSNFILIREFQKLIPNGSRVVFIGSLLGINNHASSLVYGVSKAAMHALALNLVKEFEYTNTTINVIVPGFVETEWQKDKPQNIRESINRKTALGRFAEVSEIVSAFDFCLSNAFVNGSLIEVSGGYNYK